MASYIEENGIEKKEGLDEILKHLKLHNYKICVATATDLERTTKYLRELKIDEYFDRIVEHKSFFYSLESGGGSSFLGNFFNYLSSPISLVVLLFDRKEISYAITTLVIIKGVLSAATFTYFLKKSLNSHCLASASFGVFYAFCGYFLAYYWNIMWIDGMIWLPLIALGIEQIINNGKPTLYIVSLTVLLFSSYYMGYMCCIFSVLYFIVYYFMHSSITDKISPDAKYKNRYSTNYIK